MSSPLPPVPSMAGARSIAPLVERVTAVGAATTCGEIDRSFRNRWTFSSIIVTSSAPGGRPGLVSRARFLATMAGHRGYGRLQWDGRPIGELAQWDTPLLSHSATLAQAVVLLGSDAQHDHDLLVVDDDGRPVGVVRPVRVMQALADRAVQQAATDQLTGVASRSHLIGLLASRLAQIGPGLGAVVVAFIDLDRLKAVNDALGHSWGDALLRSVVRRIVTRLEPTDAIGRLGGDEFAVVRCVSPIDVPEVERLALDLGQVLCAAVAATDAHLPSAVVTRASVGLAIALSPETSADAVLHEADQAMYTAKSAGGDRAYLAGAAAPAPSSWAEGRNLEVVYQPIVDTAQGRLVAVEALLRQRNADGGLDGPHVALESAARAGMSFDLDRWILDRACRDMVGWHARNGITAPGAVHVNLAADSLPHAGLAQAVLATIDATGLPRHRVRLELSERAGVSDLTAALGQLQAIADGGVAIALDDLGASLDTLRILDRLPIDALKIDRSVVIGAGSRAPIDTEVLTLLVRLARRLDLQLVGEGVEELAEENALHSLGVHLMQGFRYSHPVPAADIERCGGAAVPSQRRDLDSAPGPTVPRPAETAPATPALPRVGTQGVPQAEPRATSGGPVPGDLAH